MNILDVLLIIWLGLSLISGLRMGFIYKVGTLVGFIAGIYIASRLTPTLAHKFHAGPNYIVMIFLFIMSLVSKLMGLLSWFINKIFNIVAFLPFLKTFNRILGGLLSILISALVLSVGLYIFTESSALKNRVAVIQDSSVAQGLLKLSVFYKPLLSQHLDNFFDERKSLPFEQ